MSTVCAKVAQRLATVTHAVGVTIDTRTDDEGDRVIEQIDALGAATRFTYDDAGRLVAQTLPNGIDKTLAWDAADQLTRSARIGKYFYLFKKLTFPAGRPIISRSCCAEAAPVPSGVRQSLQSRRAAPLT